MADEKVDSGNQGREKTRGVDFVYSHVMGREYQKRESGYQLVTDGILLLVRKPVARGNSPVQPASQRPRLSPFPPFVCLSVCLSVCPSPPFHFRLHVSAPSVLIQYVLNFFPSSYPHLDSPFLIPPPARACGKIPFPSPRLIFNAA